MLRASDTITDKQLLEISDKISEKEQNLGIVYNVDSVLSNYMKLKEGIIKIEDNIEKDYLNGIKLEELK